MRSRAAVACGAIGAALLAGCATEPAPVEDRSLGAPEAPIAIARPHVEGAYRVVRGDTLYSIAFKRGLDYRDVAAWNGIAPPYRILVDQELRLGPPNGATVATAMRPSAPPASAASSMPRNTSNSSPPSSGATTIAAAPSPATSASMFEDVPASQYAPPPAPVESSSAVPAPASSTSNGARVVEAGVSAPATNPPPAPQSIAKPVVAASSSAPVAPIVAETVAPPAVKPAAVSTPPSTPATKPNDSTSASVNGISWRWPSSGKLVGGFIGGDQTKQGIDIAGSAGDPVRAAADGEVVYSGNGLIGYGELIIVKHNASFLSAYGHNRKRLVAEGDKVRAGQQIAEMGSSGAARDALHFEIRKNGKPVNPADYLPAR